jgi:hypothetical protein
LVGCAADGGSPSGLRDGEGVRNYVRDQNAVIEAKVKQVDSRITQVDGRATQVAAQETQTRKVADDGMRSARGGARLTQVLANRCKRNPVRPPCATRQSVLLTAEHTAILARVLKALEDNPTYGRYRRLHRRLGSKGLPTSQLAAGRGGASPPDDPGDASHFIGLGEEKADGPSKDAADRRSPSLSTAPQTDGCSRTAGSRLI